LTFFFCSGFQHSGDTSDNLDDSEGEKEQGQPENQAAGKKRKLTKAAEAKLKAKEKKKRGIKDSDDDMDEDDDAYTAPSRIMRDGAVAGTGPRPAPGSFENCAKCEKRFTVVRFPC
jgi:DNA repair protein RAD7